MLSCGESILSLNARRRNTWDQWWQAPEPASPEKPPPLRWNAGPVAGDPHPAGGSPGPRSRAGRGCVPEPRQQQRPRSSRAGDATAFEKPPQLKWACPEGKPPEGAGAGRSAQGPALAVSELPHASLRGLNFSPLMPGRDLCEPGIFSDMILLLSLCPPSRIAGTDQPSPRAAAGTDDRPRIVHLAAFPSVPLTKLSHEAFPTGHAHGAEHRLDRHCSSDRTRQGTPEPFPVESLPLPEAEGSLFETGKYPRRNGPDRVSPRQETRVSWNFLYCSKA